MKIKSDLDLIKKAYKEKISLSEVQNYLIKNCNNNTLQLEFLKVEIIRFKLKIVKEKIKELRDSPKFLTMQLNYEIYGKDFPLIKYSLEPKDANLSDEEHSIIFQKELNLFIDEFIPTEFIGLKRIEILLNNMSSDENSSLNNDININTPKSEIVWKGNQVNFFEVFKGLIESDMISIGQNEEETFNYLKNIFNLPKFNLRGARQSSGKRLDGINIYDQISHRLQKWRDKS